MTKPFANPLLATPDRPLPRAVAIIGAGTIGPDIGYYLKSALPGLKLYLVDVSQKAVDSALLRFQEDSKKAVARGKMSEADAAAVTSNLVGTLDYADIAGCDWVIEAATENLSLKRKIFAQIEAVVRPDALITSNTSSLPAAQIFSPSVRFHRWPVTASWPTHWKSSAATRKSSSVPGAASIFAPNTSPPVPAGRPSVPYKVAACMKSNRPSS